jgi:hypothetical protein
MSRVANRLRELRILFVVVKERCFHLLKLSMVIAHLCMHRGVTASRGIGWYQLWCYRAETVNVEDEHLNAYRVTLTIGFSGVRFIAGELHRPCT